MAGQKGDGKAVKGVEAGAANDGGVFIFQQRYVRKVVYNIT